MLKKFKKRKFFKKTQKRLKGYLSRRPHRSFRLSRKRDYQRELVLPGYLEFNAQVWKILWRQRRLFLSLILFAIVAYSLTGLIASQGTVKELKTLLDSTSKNFLKGNWGEAGKATLLFVSLLSSLLTGDLSDSQAIYFILLTLFFWLVVTWLLRNILAKRKVNLRDGLYNAGAPILPTLLVLVVVLIQLLPIFLTVIAYSSAVATDFHGIEAMLFFFGASLLVLMSIYFITSSLFALVIIALPGVAPMEALRMSGDLVIGRRARLLKRALFMLLTVAVVWLMVVVPIIMLNFWVASFWEFINKIPIVPLAVAFLLASTVIWVSAYMYLLYREVIKNE